jgi:hypothetical protein
MNTSISTGRYINDWKVAKVIPLITSADAFDVCNYRPISIISVPSKILERHVHSTFYYYLESHRLITPHQSGFRPKHSCDTALLKMTDDWLSNTNQGNVTGLIYIDLKKAFDTVDHTIMIQKLAVYGVRGISWNWFFSYLDSRSQLVMWQGECSDTQSITVGVPQGSILGPLLFTLYINDLPDILDESIHLYADDGTLQAVGKDIKTVELKLTDAFAKTVNWMNLNKLTIHLRKTKVQLIGSYRRVTKNTKVTVKCENRTLDQVSRAKLLGIHIDSNLTWQDHYNYICKKISQKIGVLK